MSRKYNDVEQIYQRIVDAFHEKYPVNEKLQKAVAGKQRTILVECVGGRSQGYRLDHEHLERVDPASVTAPDIRLTTTEEDLLAVFNKELPPLTAYLTKRVKVKAGLGDMMLAKSFLG